jgi:poly-beta-1,6-N-acetyl-D-glucosamine biosynthesis protein PgaD
MGEPRPRSTVIAKSLIIDAEAGTPSWTHIRDGVMTGLMWVLYLYLIQDAFYDFYLLGVRLYDWGIGRASVPNLTQVFGLLRTMGFYAIGAIVNALIFFAWAHYNKLRFRGREHRKAFAHVVPADLSELYGVPVETIVDWQKARTLVMDHDEKGALLSVTLSSRRPVIEPREIEQTGPASADRSPPDKHLQEPE